MSSMRKRKFNLSFLLLPTMILILLIIPKCPEKETIFNYDYKVVFETSAISYIFTGDHKPPLDLSNENRFINSVNNTLQTDCSH